MPATEPIRYASVPSEALRQEGGVRPWMGWVYLALHLLALGVFWTGITRAELLGCLLLLQFRGLCISAGYHRLLAHRAFKTGRVVRFLLAAVACTAFRGGPLWWAALHRYHHRHSDTDGDIITPARGFWWNYGGWLLSGKYDRTDYTQVRDYARAPELRWLNRNWLVPPLLLGAATLLLGGWSGFITVFCLSSVLGLHSMALLDVLNHLLGWQHYDTGDGSRNSFVVALFFGGEGWHNNHHHYPASARQGFRWWQVDGTFTFLRVLSWLRLVRDLKTPPASIVNSRLLSSARPAARDTQVVV